MLRRVQFREIILLPARNNGAGHRLQVAQPRLRTPGRERDSHKPLLASWALLNAVTVDSAAQLVSPRDLTLASKSGTPAQPC